VDEPGESMLRSARPFQPACRASDDSLPASVRGLPPGVRSGVH
jgi:hypothetical protein